MKQVVRSNRTYCPNESNILSAKPISRFLFVLLMASASMLSPPTSGGLQEPVQPVNIILDSDIAHNADDVGDHAMLWALAARGEANVLALITSSTNDYSASCARAIAKFYGHPSVLIGANQGTIPNTYAATSSSYTQQVTNQFGTPGDSRVNYPNAVTVYRQALANAPDRSVYIVVGGFYRPLLDLLQSGPDAISPLTGLQLVAQKVRRAVLSAGRFPDSGSSPEGNLANDPDSANYVVANWPTEVVWLGYDEGWNVITGPAANADPATNPVKLAYNLQCQNGTYCANSTPAWTQIALLYAVRGGLGSNFSVGGQNGSTVVWGNTQSVPGRSIWSQTPDRQHAYLLRAIAPEDTAAILNPLVQWIPNPSTRLDQNITFTPLAPRTYGDPPFAVSATASSGLPITFTVGATDNCSISSGNLITLNGAGVCTVTAHQAGSGNYRPAPDVPQTFNIAKATAGIQLTGLNPTYDGTPKPIVITTSPAGLAVITTYNGLTTVPASAGSYTVIVTINDANYQGTATATLVIGGAVTATSVRSSRNPSAFGQSVTFTSVVSSAAGTPAGSITFYDGAVSLGTGTLSSGSTILSTSALAAGNHSITAVYTGNANFQGSTSPVLVQIVNQAATTTTLSSSLNPSRFGQAVTLTATVRATNSVPMGTVTFTDRGTILGSSQVDSSGRGVIVVTTLAVGAHAVTAAYAPGGNWLSSTSPTLTQTVNKGLTTTILTSSLNPSHVGQQVTFTAVVGTNTAIATGTVLFTDGSNPLATVVLDATGTASFTTSSLTARTHQIRASYSGDTRFQASSVLLTQTVAP